MVSEIFRIFPAFYGKPECLLLSSQDLANDPQSPFGKLPTHTIADS
jgi:hypothetical protein